MSSNGSGSSRSSRSSGSNEHGQEWGGVCTSAGLGPQWAALPISLQGTSLGNLHTYEFFDLNSRTEELPRGLSSKKSTCQCRRHKRHGFNPWVRKTPWSRKWHGEGNGNPLQHSCLENPHGQRSLAGYSPWGHKQLDPTEGVCTRTVAGSAPPQITLLAINCMFLENTDAT